ncbi:MAG: SulP family inorganic anion transporter [Bacteroidia bacterium]|nr:SulP family inorganic anion transporter [Bacteroidia bacterium]
MALAEEMRLNLPSDGIKISWAIQDLGAIRWSLAAKHGGLIGVVATLETLLSIEAVDKMDPYRRRTPKRQEILAQGLGNLVAGSVGALPITQVIVRSSAAVQAGGYGRLTTLFHGLCLGVFGFLLTPWLSYIPLASISAILVVVGYKLLKPSIFIEFAKRDIRRQLAPFVITFIGVMSLDLLAGVGMGLGLSTFLLLWESYRLGSYAELHQEGIHWTLRLSEQITFLNKAHLNQTLMKVPPGTDLFIDTRAVRYMDADVADLLAEYAQEAHKRGIRVRIGGDESAKGAYLSSSKQSKGA